VEIEKHEPLKAELQAFVQCVRARCQPVVSGHDGRNALDVALRILDAIRSDTRAES
jgi:predicted dehydrogenase